MVSLLSGLSTKLSINVEPAVEIYHILVLNPKVRQFRGHHDRKVRGFRKLGGSGACGLAGF